jgi:hypothetical protein
VADSPFPGRDKYDDDNIVYSVSYGDGKFIAGWNNNSRMAYSTDGVTWTAATGSPIRGRIRNIAYGGGKFVAVTGGSTVFYSEDGVTWTEGGPPNQYDVPLISIAYGGGKFVLGGHWWAPMWHSEDGVTWNGMANYIFSDKDSAVIGLAYGGGKFIAVGNKAEMGYSTDGVTWTAIEQSPFGEPEAVDIAYGSGKFVAVSSKYVEADDVWDNKMAYSADGITWTAIEQSVFGEDDPLRSIAYGGGKFVAVGAWDGKMAYSADGVTWAAVEDSPTSNRGIFGIAYGNGRFVVALGEDKIAYSSNQE